MTSEALEFSISQYLDGTLSVAEREALEVRLADDEEARALLEEYRRLDGVLKASPMPEVRWEALASHISAAVADAADEADTQQRHRLKMPWLRLAVPLALAASLVVATGLALRFLRHDEPSSIAKMEVHPEAVPALAIVTGPVAEAATGPVEMQVSVGPGPAVADESLLSRYSDDVVSRPSRVTVASGINPPHDIDLPAAELQ